ncbi:MAG: alpha/beta hydrolase [Pseudomonadota bacterium]
MGHLVCLVIAAGLIAGCANRAATPVDDPSYETEQIYGEAFSLRYWHRGIPTSRSVIHVYIEGDGRRWLRGAPPRDPTPSRPISAQLAHADRHPAVVYIARPCQYLSDAELARCTPLLWTSGRYSEVAIAAIQTALDNIRWKNAVERNPRFGLIGHSGGGTLAGLVATRRNDVAWLITAGANLDHAAWTRYHRVTPLADSVRLTDFDDALVRVPQLHLAGARDRIVPPALIDDFVERFGGHPNVRSITVPEIDHTCCWQAVLSTVLPEFARMSANEKDL